MVSSKAPPGGQPSTAYGNDPEAVTRVTKPTTAPTRETGPLRVVQRVTDRDVSPAPPLQPTPEQEQEPTAPTPSPAPTIEPEEPLPTGDIELLQKMLLELRNQSTDLRELQADMRAMRQVLAGPFRFLTFSPSSVNITTPLAIAASGRRSLVVQQTFPGSIVFIAVMTSERTARIVPTFDGTQSAIDVDQLVTFEINQAISPAGFNVQADPANSRFTTVLNPGTPEGLSFFQSFALDVENTGTASMNVLDFLVVMRRYVPLALFPQLTQLEPG